jgi:hypothetical protein
VSQLQQHFEYQKRHRMSNNQICGRQTALRHIDCALPGKKLRILQYKAALNKEST